MRKIALIAICLVAVVGADKLGYSYSPVSHSNSGLSFAPGGFGGSSNLGGFSGPNSYQEPAPVAEYSKEFYSFTAPENEFDDNDAAQRLASTLKKNIRVIFIKNPENNALENAVLALAKQASEQKTAIYVLNKQTDIGDLAHKLNAAHNNNRGKPEVHFVKYRTHEDAANAQRTIESQYHQLGGTSQNHNGGVAPVLNFASPAQVHAAPARAPGNAYLPSSIFRLR